ncbi:MAG: UDP-glucose 6-dehydrogenase [Candidatus Schekmanbacteria bacterium RBG_16_38_11]|uniref:UDP-glucose 6-dehydrogenase n=1 Tax=Candidatus Schekmanbacteria bacterium RBG_16_38_11 TaxID=1817880 RepID=A0A1F7RU17_9BACT|nr:MAG: UDP-glucose 6-dehydrogenase [Candidatus Schekmanbacteria bacterium RBG_16_38_11]
MNICVIGTGYVGLVTGAVFADLGNDVICVDNDEKKIQGLNKGIMPIYEPGLEEMVSRNFSEQRLTFTTDLEKGVKRSDVIFIAVGTPPKKNGETDLTYVEEAARGIAKYIDKYKVIVNKSTVPVGTGDFVKEIIDKNKKVNVDFDVVSNPEFLREGSAIRDTLHPDRIVIGAPTKQVAMVLLELYATLERPMIITDIYSAEMIKYASNSFLALKISFVNSVADLCERTGANVTDVAKGMGLDSRIGINFLEPGLGYGGSCFPKDVDSFIKTAERFSFPFDILKAVVEVNRQRVPNFVNKMKEVLGGFKGKTIGILGLSFKPNTDDIRDAKSLEIIAKLLDEGASIRAYDPVAMENTRALFPDITYCNNAYNVAEGCDAVTIVTEWREFKFLNLEKIKQVMKKPIIFDGRNIYQPERKKKLGFEYYSIGRQKC